MASELPEIGFFHFFLFILCVFPEFLDHPHLGENSRCIHRIHFLVVVFPGREGHVWQWVQAHVVDLSMPHAEALVAMICQGPCRAGNSWAFWRSSPDSSHHGTGWQDRFQPEPVAQFIHVLPGGTLEVWSTLSSDDQPSNTQAPGVLVPGMFYPEIQILQSAGDPSGDPAVPGSEMSSRTAPNGRGSKKAPTTGLAGGRIQIPESRV